MELVFATHNEHKLNEVQQLLPDGIRLLSLDDIGCTEEIKETGKTIEENASIKANYVFEKYNRACFADDTGLIVDSLEGEPGVMSARYAGPQKNADLNMDKLLRKLDTFDNRKARFKTVIALKTQEEFHLFEGVVEGTITRHKMGGSGFGYDPIFNPLGYSQTFAEMKLAQKNRISHRSLAFSKLLDHLRNWS